MVDGIDAVELVARALTSGVMIGVVIVLLSLLGARRG